LTTALDIALLINFFGHYNGSVRGRTRIQKDICILKYKDNIPFTFEFESNYYGPYSYSLSDTVDTLIAAGLLEETVVLLSSGVKRYDYKLTQEGNELFENSRRALRRKEPGILSRLNTRTRRLQRLTISEATIQAKKCSGIQSIS
jgi:hypothetical protein